MVKRTEPRSRTDDRVFPVRIFYCGDDSRPDWFLWNDAEVWLNENVGSGNWARHGSGLEIKLYLRDPADAQRFAERFPHFKLRDFTEHAPHLRGAADWRAPDEIADAK